MPAIKPPTTAIMNYTPMKLEDLDAQEKAIGFGGGGGEFYKWKDGKNVLRLLPGLHGNQYRIPFFKHFVPANKADPQGKAWGGPCPAKMMRQFCPVCAVTAKLSRGTDTDRSMAKDLSPRQRLIANVLDRSDPDKGAQIAEYGTTVSDGIKAVFKNTEEDPTNPGPTGYDLIIEKSGAGLKTEYVVVASRKTCALHDDPAKAHEIMDQAPNLSQYVIIPTEAEIMARLGGTVLSPLLSSIPMAGAPPARRPSTTPGQKAARASASAVIDVDDPDADDTDEPY